MRRSSNGVSLRPPFRAFVRGVLTANVITLKISASGNEIECFSHDIIRILLQELALSCGLGMAQVSQNRRESLTCRRHDPRMQFYSNLKVLDIWKILKNIRRLRGIKEGKPPHIAGFAHPHHSVGTSIGKFSDTNETTPESMITVPPRHFPLEMPKK